MSTNSKSHKCRAALLIAMLILTALRGIAAAAPVIAPLSAPVLAGDSLRLAGSGFTPGSMVNFFVSTANGPLNEGPLKPAAATPPH